MGMLVNLILSGLAVFISAYLIPGVTVDGFFTAIVVAIVLALVNALIKPVILFFTLPINILTLGLFTIVIEILMVFIVAAIVPGFVVAGWLPAILFALVLSLVSGAIHTFGTKKE